MARPGPAGWVRSGAAGPLAAQADPSQRYGAGGAPEGVSLGTGERGEEKPLLAAGHAVPSFPSAWVQPVE